MLTSKINKPIVGVAPGLAYNSGATMLQATGFPVLMPESKLAFNEVSFGFVPHSGASFYLSRLPGEVGTFLALTGLPISGIDAKQFGIADEIVHSNPTYEEDVTEILMAMDFPIPNWETLSHNGNNNPWRNGILERLEGENEALLADQHEALRKKLKSVHEEFQEPKDKLPSLTAETDYKYKQLLKQYNERFAKHATPGYLDGEGEFVYQNYYRYVMEYLRGHSGHQFAVDAKGLLQKNQAAINRCFYPSTLEEITENLKKEGTPFAQLCLDKMANNSTLSMKLALQLLRDARSLDFKGALKNEINVALNKIADKEFDLGVSEVLLRPNQQRRSNPGFASSVSQDQVKSYFAPNKWADQI